MASAHRAIVTLTTDFGLGDTYVAAMKAVILSIHPEAVLVDICHAVQPQNVLQAAFLLSTVYGYFPPHTVHVVVVDPGVGTARRAVLLTTPAGRFLAPDSGVLSYVLGHGGTEEADTPPRPSLREVPLREGTSAYALTNPRWWRHPVSPTFHGRDVFAPVAAHLSLGVAPEELGEAIDRILAFPVPRPRRIGRPSVEGLVGHVLHVDSFGNLVTDIREADLPPGRLRIKVRGYAIEGLSTTYAQGGDLLALVGSSGYLEIAAQEASAAQRLGAVVGDRVLVSRL